MKNITLSAEEHLIELARKTAKERNTTLNQAFREWLADYTRRKNDVKAIDEIYKRLTYTSSGGKKFTREEMNER